VLYALTTGKHPFRKESDAATMYNICSPQPVLPPRKFLPNYPESLERVILRALAKSPDLRYDSANSMLRDLDRALPPADRANTDEDVAHFVRKLVGAKLEERRATLSDALVRADENTASNHRMPDMPSLPSASSVSTVGLAQSLIPTDANVTATVFSGFDPRKRKKLMAGGAALVAALSLGLFLLLRGPHEAPATPVPAPGPVAGSPVPTSAPGPAAHTANAEAPILDADAAAAEAPSASANKPESPPVWRGAARPMAPAAPSAPKAPRRDWRQDPGF
jgi:serine/threonine-protein kinase